MKEDVEKSIPPKEETLVEVELTLIQKKYYKALLERNRDILYKGCVGKNVPNMMNLMMQLRLIIPFETHAYILSSIGRCVIIHF
jgi:chromodomain-helicase-DNA-binding protein 7